MGHLLAENEVKNTYGTGSFILMNIGNTPKKSKMGLLTTVLYKGNRSERVKYGFEGAIETAGVVVNWLKNNMKFFDTYEELKDLHNSVDSSGGVTFVPAFTGLYSPYWDTSVSGTIFGLSIQTQKGHLIRASYEAISLRTTEVIENLEKDSGIVVKNLKVDGGLSESTEFLQTQSDILNKNVIRHQQKEITIIGSAIVAGLEKSINIWKNEEEVMKMLNFEQVFRSKLDESIRNEIRRKWDKALGRAKNWK